MDLLADVSILRSSGYVPTDEFIELFGCIGTVVGFAKAGFTGSGFKGSWVVVLSMGLIGGSF